MAAIPNITTSQATSPQLTGILTMAPIPGPLSAVNPNGSAATYTPASSVIVGGDTNGSPFSLQLGTANGTVAAGQVVGGGTAPVAGAQPAAPGAPAAPGTPALVANPVANPLATIGAAAPATTGPTIIAAPGEVPTPTATATPSPAAADMAPGGTGAAVAESGFGAAERSKPMKASVDGATFGFPSFKASAKSNKAPAITWGPGWNRVEKDGMYYMQHANGTKAVPAVEYRVNSSPVGKVQTVKVANGWGKKFPDGTVVVFDRTEGPYRLDAKGKKHQLGLGTHTFGGVKTRIFEASVVRTLEPTGTVTVFDSRGNNRAGTNRGTIAAAISGAGAGAEMASAPTKGGGAPTKGGGADVGDLAGNVDKLTSVARGILDQVRGGNLDPAALASLQAQLNALPAGIVQAAAAAGATSPSPVEGSGPATKSTIPGTTTAGGAAPIAGTDANKATKELAAGAAATLATPAPAELVGKQARFGQLPEAIQVAVATAYGS
ncbi:MAG: hypothetical protein JWO69_502, partial [Thermoleophilia bacterium]|nr:hypothetical protein [Thermoleophilia bacterium]